MNGGRWSWAVGLTVLLASACVAVGEAQSVSLLHGVDLRHIRLEVKAPAEHQRQLYAHALARLAKAGLGFSETEDDASSTQAILAIALLPQTVDDRCAQHVIYAPSIALVEPVMVTRNGVVFRDSAWWVGEAPHVRTMPTRTEFEQEADQLLDRFLNEVARAQSEDHGPVARDATAASPAVGQAARSLSHEATTSLANLPDARGDAGLEGLAFGPVHLSVSAGQASGWLTDRAIEQLAEAGLTVAQGPGSNKATNQAVTLGIELFQHALGADCPGLVLYESGVFVVEPAGIARDPEVKIWTDSWARQTVTVVPPVSEAQLARDQQALLAEFIRAMTGEQQRQSDARQ